MHRYDFLVDAIIERVTGSYRDHHIGEIFIFQATKDGRFRGANTFQHDVDVVVEVPEKGKGVQMGRFNQGGEMDIFPSS